MLADAGSGREWVRVRGVEVAICVLLVVGVCATYYRVAGNGFVAFDDDVELQYNEHIRALSAENLRWMFTNTSQAQRYTPLSWLAWALVYRGWGLNPAAFHVQAIVVHAINAVLVFWVLRGILRQVVLRREMEGKGAGLREESLSLIAGMGAAMWTFHPLRAEVVVWASQERFGEAAIFALLSTLCYLRAAGSAGPDGVTRRVVMAGWFWGSVALFAMSLLVYPYVVGLPLIFVVMDYYPLGRFASVAGEDGGRKKGGGWGALVRLTLEKWPFLLAALLTAAAAIWGRYSTSDVYDAPALFAQFDLLHRVMQAFYIFAHYWWKPFDLLHNYPIYTTLVNFRPLSPIFLASAAFVAGMTAACAWLAWKGKWPQAVALWAAHLLLIFPMGGYFDYPHYASDRYSYMQGLTPILLVCGLLMAAWRRLAVVGRIAVVAACIGTSVLFSMLDASRIPMWRDSETLFHALLDYVGDDSYRDDIYWRLGEVHLRRHEVLEALALFDRSLSGTAPSKSRVLHYKGDALLELAEAGKRNGAPAEDLRAIYAQAASAYAESARLTPMANVYFGAAYADVQIGKNDEAIENLHRAIERAPDHVPFRLRLGQLLWDTGRREDARRVLEEACGRVPALMAERDDILKQWQMGRDSWVGGPAAAR